MTELRFRYAALTAAGDTTHGAVRALSESAAVERLKKNGLTPLSIERLKGSASHREHVKKSEVAALTRELAVLVDAKIPLAVGLAAIADGRDDDTLAGVIRDVANRIESGESISRALGQHKSVFGPVFIETMRAAEQSGQLGPALVHLAEMQDRQIAARQALTRALAYPVVVLAFVAFALVVLLTFVIPRFAVTFESQSVELPLITRLVQGLGISMRTHWYLYASAAAGAVWSFSVAWRSNAGRLVIERLLLHVPYVRSILISDSCARFTRVLGIALSAGLGIIDAFELAAGATGRPAFVLESRRTLARLRAGSDLASALGTSKYLPGLARRMLVAGKDSAELARAARVVAEHYDARTENLSKSIGTLIEPILTILLSGVVLLVALSVFLPMWEMVRVNR